MIPLIESVKDIIVNIKTMERYLNSGSKEEKEFALSLVQKGRTIVVYFVNGENHFAPGRFIGYRNNNMRIHVDNDEKDTRDTNPLITSLIGKPFFHKAIDEKYIAYAQSLGMQPYKNKRKYWRVRDEVGKHINIIEESPAQSSV